MIRERFARKAPACLLAVALCGSAAVPAMAEAPDRGPSGQFEREYMLRMTELAAGTDRIRDAAVNKPMEGTSPSFEFGTNLKTTSKEYDYEKPICIMYSRLQRLRQRL